MSEIIVTLGGVAFRDFEVPEEIIFGGGQMLAVHQMIGGGRIVDALGSADGEIRFSGTFSGPEAAQRARALDVARSLGATLPLAWNGFFYTVVIGEFIAAYTKPWWIPFSVRLVVVADLVIAVADSVAQVALDLVSAQGFAAQAGLSLAGISTTSAAGFSNAQFSAGNLVASAGQSFSAAAAKLNGAMDAPTGIAGVAGLAGTAGILANAAGAQAYLGRAAANLNGVSA